MKRNFTSILGLIFLLPLIVQAQPEMYLSSKLKFLTSTNDTIPYPLTGGLVAPQFSDIDLNGDTVPDLFIFDRSGNKTLTFLNAGIVGQSSYIYAPQFEERFPSMIGWTLLRDYNCDGKPDIFTGTTSSGFTIYKNVTPAGGLLTFEHVVSDVLDRDKLNLYNLLMDMPAIDDIDGDGDLDIMAFGVLGGYVEYYRNERVEDGLHCDSIRYKFVDFCWGSFLEGGLSNQLFLGQTGCGKYYQKNARHSGSTLLTFDNDADGDKELVLGDVDYPTLNFLENGKKDHSWAYDTMISYYGGFPLSKRTYIDRFPAAFYVDVNNDGVKDLISASNEPVAATNLHQVWFYRNKGQNNNPDFEFQDSNFIQDQTIDFGSGSSPRFFDVDGDNDLDLLLVHRGNYRLTKNTADRVALFTNIGNASNPIYKLSNENLFGLIADSIAGLRISFGDLNGDGLKDMVCGEQGGKLKYYRNNGSATNPTFTLETSFLGSIDVGSYSAPLLHDVDGDNLQDLFVGATSGTISYFHNTGSTSQPAFSSTPDQDSVGNILVNDFFYAPVYDSAFNIVDSTKTFEHEGYSDPYLADLDGDGKKEFLVGSKGGRLLVYSYDSSALSTSFPEVSNYFVQRLSGNREVADFGGRTSPACADLNNDGKDDIVIGNSRGGIHYLSTINQGVDTLLNPANIIVPEMSGIEVFPNPSQHTLNIRFEQPYANVSLEIMDLAGRSLYNNSYELLASETIKLPVNNLSPGAYFLKLTSPGYSPTSFKFLVIR